jgi:hypothetical protein
MTDASRQAAAVQDAQSDGIDRVAARLETLVARLEGGLAPALTQLSEQTAQAGRETRAALQEETARGRRDAEAREARLEATAARLADRLEAMDGRVADRLDALDGRVADKLDAVDGRVADKLDAVDGRVADKLDVVGSDLADRLEAREARAEAEREARAKAMAEEVRAVGLHLSETDARVSEGFATLRLGLRALNDRLAELGAGTAPPPREPADPAEAPAAVTVLHPAPGERSGDGAGVAELRETLESVLARLGDDGRRPAGEEATAVWRRSSALRERPR